MMISSVNTTKGKVRYAQCCSGPRPLIMLPGVSVTSVLGSAVMYDMWGDEKRAKIDMLTGSNRDEVKCSIKASK